MKANRKEPLPRQTRPAYWLQLVAITLAFLATCGSVFLSVGLGLKACPLCFYRRSFAMSVFAVLLVGMSADRARPVRWPGFRGPRVPDSRRRRRGSVR